MVRHRFVFFLLIVLGTAPGAVKQSFAQPTYDTLIGFPTPQTLELKDTGVVVLAGILREAHLDLRRHLEPGTRIRLSQKGPKVDRKGRPVVSLHHKDGRWINAEIVRSGLARVYPDPNFRGQIRDLYLQEQLARQNQNGFWQTGQFRIYDALTAEIPLNEFAIIEGVIIDVAEIKGKTYFNFGANWRDDFTLSLAKKNSVFFREFGWSASILKGKRVQIRGWVIPQNGPMVRLEHPDQLQLVK